MSLTPAVAVVVTCHNLGSYLDEAVRSVLGQTLEDIEIIVVDDGSTDPLTTELLGRYSRPKTRVLRQENRGLAAARNTGIAETTAPYICCLDADDRVRPPYLARAVELFEQQPDVGIVAAHVQLFGAREVVWHCGPCRLPEMLLANKIQSASLFRREAWQRTDGYRTGIPPALQDWDFWLSLLELGFKGEVIPEVLVEWRVREDSMWHSGAHDPAVMGPMNRAIWEAHASTYIANLGPLAELVGADHAIARATADKLERLEREDRLRQEAAAGESGNLAKAARQRAATWHRRFLGGIPRRPGSGTN